MKKRVTVFLMVAVMLFTFCTAPPAHAIVPVVAWVVWGVAVGVSSVAVMADKTKSAHEQAQANNQRQEEPKGIRDTALASQQGPN
jgi:predicted MFS family arabinose efflux permease